MTSSSGRPRVLVAIPVFNEERTVARVVQAVRTSTPRFDLVMVNDGSSDRTEAILRDLHVTTVTHLCNLGYGRALQTAIRYARAGGYDALITLDADGQHRPEDIERLYTDFDAGDFDVLIGSRFVEQRRYDDVPLTRRLGMRLFSAIVGVLTGQVIYDTSSGLKIMHRRVFDALAERPFVHFHAEVLTYLIASGYKVTERPVVVDERHFGASMYSWLGAIEYAPKVAFLTLLGFVEAHLRKGRA